MEQEYKYYAFISYSHKDEKYAKWVQNKLESYKLPSKIISDSPQLRKGIRPIFRDKTDLGAGVLYNNLGSELALSQYLIVISSPTSAASEWVGTEIREFQKTHTPDHIIPLIVGGTPNSNDANECFNPAIKEIVPELIGINIQEIGKQQALTKVVAKVLNLSYDTLWQRHKRQERQKNIISGVLLIFLLIAGIFLWDYNRPKYEYYASIAAYADGWLPKGIVPLSKEQMQHRYQTYRFTYRQRKLREVAIVNSHGKIVDNLMRFIHPYKNSVKPVIQHFNLSEDVLFLEEFSGMNYNRIDLMYPPEKGGAAFGTRTNSNSATEIRRHALTRNEHGYVIRDEFKRYPGIDEVSASDAEGVSGYEYDVDETGQITALYYINNTRNRVSLQTGLAFIRYTYNALGGIVREQYFDKEGKPSFTNAGGAETQRTFDGYGNVTVERYFDTSGEPCIAPYYGYSTFKTKYDNKGNKTEQAYYDDKDSLCLSSAYIAMLKQSFDAEGNCIEIAYFDAYARPCYDEDGYARVEQRYDNKGNLIEEDYFGADGQPCLCNLGYAKIKRQFDERGNEIKVSFFGVDGKPCIRDMGFAILRKQYDERGYLVEEAYFDTEGMPCTRELGFASLKCQYDERGNLVEETYYDTVGHLCTRDIGCAILRHQHDERGNLIEECYYDADGKPCLGNCGYATLRYDYDTRGNIIKESYYGVDGELCLSDEDFAILQRTIDERGNLIEVAYFDTKGEPCNCDMGYARIKDSYDERGKILEESFWNADNKPCLNNSGYFLLRQKYDERGNYIEESCYAVDGKPCVNTMGYSIIRRTLDERSNVLSEVFLNDKEERCNANFEYTRYPDVIDNIGCIQRQLGVCENGQVCALPGGFSKFEGKYDNRNQLIQAVYYNDRDEVLKVIDTPMLIDYYE